VTCSEPVGAWLAGDGVFEIAIASKLAPTDLGAHQSCVTGAEPCRSLACWRWRSWRRLRRQAVLLRGEW